MTTRLFCSWILWIRDSNGHTGDGWSLFQNVCGLSWEGLDDWGLELSGGEGNGNPLLPGKSHGQRSLVGYSPWDHKESDTTEWLHFHFSLWCIGGGNGNPLQYSFLENPRDRGAWWAAICGVTQSRTQLKRLSSSSSCRTIWRFLRSCFWHLSRDDSKSGLSWDHPLENLLCDWGSSLYGSIKIVKCLS